MEVVYKNKNVYTDLSGLVLGDFTEKFEAMKNEKLEDMIIYAGEPRYLLYGTDWPISTDEIIHKFYGTTGLAGRKKGINPMEKCSGSF